MFGRHMELRDIGFVSFVTFLHMEVNQTHPVKLVFCSLLVKASQSRFSKTRSISNVYRNKWLLAYTLIKNPALIKQRKERAVKAHYVRVQKVGEYFRRKVVLHQRSQSYTQL
jgi:hypothetical protein